MIEKGSCFSNFKYIEEIHTEVNNVPTGESEESCQNLNYFDRRERERLMMQDRDRDLLYEKIVLVMTREIEVGCEKTQTLELVVSVLRRSGSV